MLPLAREGDNLIIATSGAPHDEAINDLRETTGLEPILRFAYRADLEHAIECCLKRSTRILFEQMRLGEVLLTRGVIDREQLAAALKDQTVSRRRLGEILVEKFDIPEQDIYSALAKKLDLEFRIFAPHDIDPRMNQIVSKRFSESHNLVPIGLDRDKMAVTVAMSNPQDLVVADMLRKTCSEKGYGLSIVISAPTQILRGICRLYDSYAENAEELIHTVGRDTGIPAEDNSVAAY